MLGIFSLEKQLIQESPSLFIFSLFYFGFRGFRSCKGDLESKEQLKHKKNPVKVSLQWSQKTNKTAAMFNNERCLPASALMIQLLLCHIDTKKSVFIKQSEQ